MSKVDLKKLVPGWNDLEFLPDSVRERYNLHYTSIAANKRGQVVALVKQSRQDFSFPEEVITFIENGLKSGAITDYAILFYDTVKNEIVNSFFNLAIIISKIKNAEPRTVTFTEKSGEVVEHKTYFLDKHGNPAAHPLEESMSWALNF